MKTSVAESLARLRLADPAPSDQTETTTPLTVASLQPDTPTSVDVFDEHPSGRGRRTRATRLVGIAAGAVLVAGVATGATVLGGHGHHAHSTGTSTTPAAKHPADPHKTRKHAADPHKAQTQRQLQELLDAVALLPGANVATTVPQQAPGAPFFPTAYGPQDLQRIPRELATDRWWTAPGTVQQALAYLKAHPPAGTQRAGFDTCQRDYYTRVNGRYVEVQEPGMVRCGISWGVPYNAVHNDIEVNVMVGPYRGGVAVYGRASGEWLATRPASSYLHAVTAIDVTMTRTTGQPTVHRTLTGPGVQTLVDKFNSFVSTADPGDQPTPTGADSLVFRAGSKILATATAQPDGPGRIVLTVNGGGVSPLQEAGPAVTKLLVKALHLPDSYIPTI